MAPEDSKEEIKRSLKELEEQMSAPHFWDDKHQAQQVVERYQELKNDLEGVGRYDKKPAVLSIFAGAGGTDAEDFARMLFEMYRSYATGRGWELLLIHEHFTDHGGLRNITVEVKGTGAYGILKNESGVHRLVRISPFNAKNQRHTSFALVEVVPKFDRKDASEISIPDTDLKVEFSKSSGPGGQNVNKRDTAVRIVHEPTGVSVHVASERSQEQNREKAMDLLRAKLYRRLEAEESSREDAFKVSKTTEVEWGNQIRSYVLHPYQLVKDHRTNVETSDVKGVLEDGKLEPFIQAEKSL